MKKDRLCIYCNKIFENEEGRVFSNHVRWCVKNITNGDKGSKSISNAKFNRKIKLFGCIEKYVVFCNICNKSFEIFEHKNIFTEKKAYFCSRSCSNTRESVSESTKQKISASLEKAAEERGLKKKKCIVCKKIINLKLKRKTCDNYCLTKLKESKKGSDVKKNYRSKCSFKFSVYLYPDEFDFSILNELGWYKAKNRGNNLDGVSRDHMVSVIYGYENNIDPLIIAHPANCRLIKHNENVSKGKKNIISYEELLDRIKNWDEKYKTGVIS